jgi:AGZA family xanthine/uracil permease-like MFS transporter
MLDKFFGIKKAGSNVKTEVLAGLTTFLTMMYILAVNPDILSGAGMDKGALFTATAIAAAIGTLVMALVAKLPIGLAPGMGLNAFFTFGVVKGMGCSWELALTAVFIEGIIFILLTAFNVRELIIMAIPKNIRLSISVGIGLFIAFIGLQKSGIIVDNPATLVGLGDITSAPVLVAIVGLIVTGVLYHFKITGALVIGIVSATVIGIPLGVTNIENFSVFSTPPSLEPILWKFDFSQVLTMKFFIILFTFLFVDMFDTIGTLLGVTTQCGMVEKNGKIPRVKKALFADAVGTTAGAVLGTSTVTAYIESASGVSAGGRTGLTSLTTAIFFLLALFLSPLFMIIPAAATAPILIIVGVFMMAPVKDIKFDDITEAVPAFLTIIMMPLAYSIAEGIVFGMISYVLLKALTGKFERISIVMWILAALFILKFFI